MKKSIISKETSELKLLIEFLELAFETLSFFEQASKFGPRNLLEGQKELEAKFIKCISNTELFGLLKAGSISLMFMKSYISYIQDNIDILRLHCNSFYNITPNDKPKLRALGELAAIAIEVVDVLNIKRQLRQEQLADFKALATKLMLLITAYQVAEFKVNDYKLIKLLQANYQHYEQHFKLIKKIIEFDGKQSHQKATNPNFAVIICYLTIVRGDFSGGRNSFNELTTLIGEKANLLRCIGQFHTLNRVVSLLELVLLIEERKYIESKHKALDLLIIKNFEPQRTDTDMDFEAYADIQADLAKQFSNVSMKYGCEFESTFYREAYYKLAGIYYDSKAHWSNFPDLQTEGTLSYHLNQNLDYVVMQDYAFSIITLINMSEADKAKPIFRKIERYYGKEYISKIKWEFINLSQIDISNETIEHITASFLIYTSHLGLRIQYKQQAMKSYISDSLVKSFENYLLHLGHCLGMLEKQHTESARDFETTHNIMKQQYKTNSYYQFLVTQFLEQYEFLDHHPKLRRMRLKLDVTAVYTDIALIAESYSGIATTKFLEVISQISPETDFSSYKWIFCNMTSAYLKLCVQYKGGQDYNKYYELAKSTYLHISTFIQNKNFPGNDRALLNAFVALTEECAAAIPELESKCSSDKLAANKIITMNVLASAGLRVIDPEDSATYNNISPTIGKLLTDNEQKKRQTSKVKGPKSLEMFEKERITEI